MEPEQSTRLGSVAGLEIRADRSALFGSLGLWAVALGALLWGLDLPPVRAALAAGALLGLHWLTVFWHHLGHALAATSTGFPMRGLRLYALLASDFYPDDEPRLPVRVHARRALGGPAASLVLTLALAVIGWWVGAANPALRFAAWILAAENFLVFTVGVFVPLGFSDGGTLLRLWRWGSPHPPGR